MLRERRACEDGNASFLPTSRGVKLARVSLLLHVRRRIGHVANSGLIADLRGSRDCLDRCPFVPPLTGSQGKATCRGVTASLETAAVAVQVCRQPAVVHRASQPL